MYPLLGVQSEIRSLRSALALDQLAASDKYGLLVRLRLGKEVRSLDNPAGPNIRQNPQQQLRRFKHRSSLEITR